mmetsp:Transcript_7318/g.10810  ORF Transcript_7318/g.10810 Transcript_7318/m.10810 type:complete len:106 (+) Transcript_7318:139-456(+)
MPILRLTTTTTTRKPSTSTCTTGSCFRQRAILLGLIIVPLCSLKLSSAFLSTSTDKILQPRKGCRAFFPTFKNEVTVVKRDIPFRHASATVTGDEEFTSEGTSKT